MLVFKGRKAMIVKTEKYCQWNWLGGADCITSITSTCMCIVSTLGNDCFVQLTLRKSHTVTDTPEVLNVNLT